jgi:glutathione S-transferase
MNPNGTGPVLRDEGSEPVWETGANNHEVRHSQLVVA